MERLSERCIRFLHLADLHFGTETYGKMDPETGVNTRLLDFSRTLERVLDQALEMGIDAVLFAGDAYRTNRPTPTQEREFARHVERLYRAGIPLVLLVGNHDLPVGRGQANALDVFRTLKISNLMVVDQAEVIQVQTRRGVLQVACVPYPTRHKLLTKTDTRQMSEDGIRQTMENALVEFINESVEKRHPEQPFVVLAHITVSEAKLSGTERTMLLADEVKLLPGVLKQQGIDYAALGHIHRFQDLNPGGQPPVVYPGALERIDFSEENDVKGFVIVDVEPGKAHYQFHPIACRNFVTIELDLTQVNNPTEALAEKIEEKNIEGAVVRVRCTATEEQTRTLDLQEIDKNLKVAQHLAGLSIRPPEKQVIRRRSSLTESSSLDEALKTYLSQQGIDQESWEELLKRAHQLEQKLE